MDPYRIVEVPLNPAQAAAVLNAQAGEDYYFRGWLQQPSGGNSGYGIFEHVEPAA